MMASFSLTVAILGKLVLPFARVILTMVVVPTVPCTRLEGTTSRNVLSAVLGVITPLPKSVGRKVNRTVMIGATATTAYTSGGWMRAAVAVVCVGRKVCL